MRFMVQADGSKVEFFLRNLKLRDWSEIWPAAAKVFWRIMDEQFRSQGSRGLAGQWAPLSPEYFKRKQKKYPLSTTLQASGRLHASLTGETRDTRLVMEPLRFQIGTEVPYAVYHQSTAARKKLPRRPMIDFREDDRKLFARALMSAAYTKFRKLGYKLLGRDATPTEARLAGQQWFESGQAMPLSGAM